MTPDGNAIDRYRLPAPLDRAHAWARSKPWLRRFTLANRLLLAMAFLPTGLVKLTGQRFTLLPVEDPIGFFFEAMYRTGAYWHFIGLVQVLAAVLLLIPATAAWGALLFLPVGASVLLITWGIGFEGTIWVTLAMMLSVLYLVAWEGDRVWAAGRHLLGSGAGPRLLADMHWLETVGWVGGGAVGLVLFMTTRGFIASSWNRPLFLAGIVSAALVVSGWIASWFRTVRPSADRAGV
jgi:hypothetical protein